MFQSDIASVSDDAKDWSGPEQNILHLWLLNLQISQGEYTLFSANIFVKLACLRVKFRGDVNLLDVLTQYEILGFCRLGLNRLGADY